MKKILSIIIVLLLALSAYASNPDEERTNEIIKGIEQLVLEENQRIQQDESLVLTEFKQGRDLLIAGKYRASVNYHQPYQLVLQLFGVDNGIIKLLMGNNRSGLSEGSSIMSNLKLSGMSAMPAAHSVTLVIKLDPPVALVADCKDRKCCNEYNGSWLEKNGWKYCLPKGWEAQWNAREHIVCSPEQGKPLCPKYYNKCVCVPNGGNSKCNEEHCVACTSEQGIAVCPEYGECICVPPDSTFACNNHKCITCTSEEGIAVCPEYGECICVPPDSTFACNNHKCITCTSEEGIATYDTARMQNPLCVPQGSNFECFKFAGQEEKCYVCSANQKIKCPDLRLGGECVCALESSDTKCSERDCITCAPEQGTSYCGYKGCTCIPTDSSVACWPENGKPVCVAGLGLKYKNNEEKMILSSIILNADETITVVIDDAHLWAGVYAHVGNKEMDVPRGDVVILHKGDTISYGEQHAFGSLTYKGIRDNKLLFEEMSGFDAISVGGGVEEKTKEVLISPFVTSNLSY